MKEDKASSYEAAFLLVAFCKISKQMKLFVISQLIHLLKYTRLLLNALVHLPMRPVLLFLEPRQEVEMTHDHIIKVSEHAAL